MRSPTNLRIVATVVLAVTCFGIYRYCAISDSPLDAVRRAWQDGAYNQVRDLAIAADSDGLTEPAIWWYAGQACRTMGDLDEATAYFQKASESDQFEVRAWLQMAEISEAQSRYADAINMLISLIDKYPTSIELRRSVARLLDISGRRYEANIQHLELVSLKQYSIDDLVLLADRHEPFAGPEIEKAMHDPRSTSFRVARAMIAWRSGKPGEAATLLRAEITVDESALEPHALLGLVMLDQGKMEELSRWHAELPDSADGHPDVWYVRGVWAEQLGRQNMALTCYQRALRLDGSFQQAMFRLTNVARNSISDELRSQLTERIAAIEQYRLVCKTIFFRGPEIALASEAVDLAESLGRFPEAIGWCGVLDSQTTGAAVVSWDRVHRLQAQVGSSESSKVADIFDALPGLDGTILEWPEPPQTITLTRTAALPVQFVNQASELNLDFEYRNGAHARSGLMIQQSMGGGVAVLDYDRDTWPDLFFPQGESTGNNNDDGLFRNKLGRSFLRIDRIAECGSRDYSHGAAAGDVNDDGFPDLYVAVSGRNKLYFNNGDGTFRCHDDAFDTEKWTVSCAIADLNGDGFPELFDVNYLEWGKPFTEVCIDSQLGLARTCPPERFNGERNELLLNSGDGQFRNVTDEVGLGELVGKGLGIVAADFDGTGNLSVFVANDQVPNLYLQRDADPSDHRHSPLQFINNSFAEGIAFNGAGEALACMGVATADVNHDGRLDIFVTNFYRQPNTLYVAVAPSGFQDMTSSSGLLEPGLLKLGFGTQFLDANLDGEPDLVVGNGHLDDFTQKGIPFAMQPQLFLNRGEMQFEESPGSSLGNYFETEHLARGLARVDWNRDGLPDFAVSHIDEPVGLLTNQTVEHGHSLTLYLSGSRSARDATGATVTVSTQHFTRTQHLTAGDGYAASNQKNLIFGLGTDAVALSILVRWPSGDTQDFENIRADSEYIVSESAPRLLVMPQ